MTTGTAALAAFEAKLAARDNTPDATVNVGDLYTLTEAKPWHEGATGAEHVHRFTLLMRVTEADAHGLKLECVEVLSNEDPLPTVHMGKQRLNSTWNGYRNAITRGALARVAR